MDIFLVVIIYVITTSGGFAKTTYETKTDTTLAVCKVIASRAKIDKVLNTPKSYVYSAHCELRKKPE